MFIQLLLWELALGVETQRGPVMSGYDVVAYHSLQPGDKGVLGVPNYIAEWDDRTWWFSTAENMATFLANPEHYAPAYGSFCAWGMAKEYMPDYPWSWADPKHESWRAQCMGPPCNPTTAWAVIDGRLFCAINAKYMAKFQADPSLIAVADARWAGWNTPVAKGVHWNVDCIQPWRRYTPCWQRIIDLGCCVGSSNPYCPGESFHGNHTKTAPEHVHTERVHADAERVPERAHAPESTSKTKKTF